MKSDWFIWACCGLWVFTPLVAALGLFNWRMKMARRRAVVRLLKENKDGRLVRQWTYEIDERDPNNPIVEEPDND